MARASWRSTSPVEKFASGYRPHQMDSKAIREWVAARLRKPTGSKLIATISKGQSETGAALTALKALKQTARVVRAIHNAKEHQKWLRLIHAEALRQAPPSKRAPVRRQARRIQVGLLAREAAIYSQTTQARPE